MKLGDRFKVKGGKVHVWEHDSYMHGVAFCGNVYWSKVDTATAEPVTCAHCLRKLGKIKTIATLAGVAR
jgi:hypothetical protein